jgi:hypothetical protein
MIRILTNSEHSDSICSPPHASSGLGPQRSRLGNNRIEAKCYVIHDYVSEYQNAPELSEPGYGDARRARGRSPKNAIIPRQAHCIEDILLYLARVPLVKGATKGDDRQGTNNRRSELRVWEWCLATRRSYGSLGSLVFGTLNSLPTPVKLRLSRIYNMQF